MPCCRCYIGDCSTCVCRGPCIDCKSPNCTNSKNHVGQTKTNYELTSTKVQLEAVRLELTKLQLNYMILTKKYNEVNTELLNLKKNKEATNINKNDAYTILGLKNNADIDLVKIVFKKLSLIYHPDRSIVMDDEHFKKINRAHELITTQK